jgi:hypothetical protein
MIDNHHVKTAAEKIVSQFGVLNVAFNATRTNNHDPVMTFGAEANKAHRNVIHARKFSLFPLTPEIGQWPHGKGRKRVFSCFPVLLLQKHRAYTPDNR